MESASKADQILAVGQRLLQTRPYTGFSYRDIADEVGIRSASIHYHFPTKADLAVAVTEVYRTAFAKAVEQVQSSHDTALGRLRGYATLFENTLVQQERVCLCGMLASATAQLPNAVRRQVEGFFDDQHAWIAETVRDGQLRGEFTETTSPETFARAFLAGLEGAMLVAWSQDRPEDLHDVASTLLASLAP